MDQENDDQNPEEARQLFQERYGDMIPEKIIDTKIGEDGRRYYKIQWAATTMEPGNNFLEAELLIKKYWDPIEQRLKFPSRHENEHASLSSHSNNESNAVLNEDCVKLDEKNEELATCSSLSLEKTVESECGSTGSAMCVNVTETINDQKENVNKEINENIFIKRDNVDNERLTTVVKNSEETFEHEEIDQLDNSKEVFEHKELDQSEESSLKRRRCNSNSNQRDDKVSPENLVENTVSAELPTKKVRHDNDDSSKAH